MDKTIEKASKANKNNPYTKSEKKRVKKFIRKDYTTSYLADNSHCAKCGNPENLVGRNFRPCKTDKEWKKMEDKYKDNLEGLFTDFYDYTREGIEENAEKLKLKQGKSYIVKYENGKPEFIYNKTKLYDC